MKMKRKSVFALICLLAAAMLLSGCSLETAWNDVKGWFEDTEEYALAELGEPIRVDGVMELTFDEGGFGGECYAHNAQVGNYPEHARDGESLLVLYGVVKSLSSKKYRIDSICDITVLIDGEYEYYGYIFLENEGGTEFEDNYVALHPKAERHCALIAHVGNEVVAEASTIEITFNIKQDVDADEDDIEKRFVMQLTVN